MGNLKSIIGQKRHLQDADYKAIEKAASAGLWKNEDLATILKMSPEWFRRQKKENPLIPDAISRGKAKLKKDLLGPIIKEALAGDTTKAQWVLMKLYADEFNHNVKQASQNVDNRTVNMIQMPPAMSTEQYKNLVMAMSAPAILEHDASDD